MNKTFSESLNLFESFRISCRTSGDDWLQRFRAARYSRCLVLGGQEPRGLHVAPVPGYSPCTCARLARSHSEKIFIFTLKS